CRTSLSKPWRSTSSSASKAWRSSERPWKRRSSRVRLRPRWLGAGGWGLEAVPSSQQQTSTTQANARSLQVPDLRAAPKPRGSGSSLQPPASSRSAMARIDAFLKLGTDQGCSDIHFAVGLPPMLRMHGDLLPIKFRDLSQAELESYIAEIMSRPNQDLLRRGHDVDFSYVSA